MTEKDRTYWTYKALAILVALTVLNLGCKNMFKVPQAKYDLSEERKTEYERLSKNDTVIFLTLGSGYFTGSEQNHYSVTKRNDKTIVNRTSNFQKFEKIEISSSSFPWQYILDNYDKFVSDIIKTEKKIITEDGKILYQQAASHGQTTFLKVKLGETEHQIYLAPLVDSYNQGNINLDLIEKTKKTILTLEFKPREKINYQRER
jgi:hypothetical protein